MKIFESPYKDEELKIALIFFEFTLGIIIYYLVIDPKIPDWRIINLVKTLVNTYVLTAMTWPPLRKFTFEHFIRKLMTINFIIHAIICGVLTWIGWQFKAIIYCSALPSCNGKVS
jgi:hypothetical protein